MYRIFLAFLAVFSLAIPISASRAQTPADPTDQQTQAELSLCPGETSTFSWDVPVTTQQHKVDIFLAVDTTGSAAPWIYTLKNQLISVLIPELALRIENLRFGVVEFRDYPIFGDPSDYPYLRLLHFTDDMGDVQEAVDMMVGEGGGDPPESYGRALYESYSDPDYANPYYDWRSDARRYVIMIGDALPHDPDPGRDGVLDTTDDLEMTEVLDGMQDLHQPLLFFYTGETDYDTWLAYAQQTGSAGIATIGEPNELSTKVIEMVDFANSHYDQLTVEISPTQNASWWAISPMSYTNLVLTEDTQIYPFELSVTVPITASVGEDYSFNLHGVADHEVFAQQDVLIHVSTCQTSVQVESSQNPSQLGQEVIFTATVTSTVGIPDGNLSFKVDTIVVPGCTDLLLDEWGRASCTVGDLSIGLHTIDVEYAGNGSYASGAGSLAGGQQVSGYRLFLPVIRKSP